MTTASAPSDLPVSAPFIVGARETLISELIEAILQGEPLLALTGAAGAGKSTIASAIQQALTERSVDILRVGRGEAGSIDLRTITCQLLGKPEAEFDAEDIEGLFDVMTARSAPDRRVVVLIDDAHL